MAQPQLEQLEARRRQAVAEVQRLRRQLATDLAPLRAAAGCIDKGISVTRPLLRYAPFLTAASGFFMARKTGVLFRTVGVGLPALRLAMKLFGKRR